MKYFENFKLFLILGLLALLVLASWMNHAAINEVNELRTQVFEQRKTISGLYQKRAYFERRVQVRDCQLKLCQQGRARDLYQCTK